MHTNTTHRTPDTRRGLPPQPCVASRSRFARHRRTTTTRYPPTGKQASFTWPVANCYDDNGSLIQKQSASPDPKDNQNLIYDAQNRLVEVKDNAGNTVATYQYDPYGRRIGKTVHRDSQNQPLAQAETTYFLYSDAGLIAEADGQGAISTSYGWQPEGTWGTAPVFIKTTAQNQTQAQIYYYQNDHLGTPQQVIDSQGNVVWAAQATAFGETQVLPTSTIRNNLRFPGQYYDQETGLHYNYFRDYEPGVGRYIESDPIGLEGGLNTYIYVWGNPLSNWDPLGLDVRMDVANRAAGLAPARPVNPNGNYSPGFTPQDNKCTFPASLLNYNKCAKACCQVHDDCYTKYQCNSSSWNGNVSGDFNGPCQQCNTKARQCIVESFFKAECTPLECRKS
jgi:RHS repeat-associated protein